VVAMASNLDSESEDEFEGLFRQNTNSAKTKQRKKQFNRILTSDEDEDDDDNDDFQGSVMCSGRKRKAIEAFESEEDESESDEGNIDLYLHK
jgi:hypothetical protein